MELQCFTVGRLVALFCVINVIIYLDRGIVPVRSPGAAPRVAWRYVTSGSGTVQGAPKEIDEFIKDSLNVDNVTIYTGILQSASAARRSASSLTGRAPATPATAAAATVLGAGQARSSRAMPSRASYLATSSTSLLASS